MDIKQQILIEIDDVTDEAALNYLLLFICDLKHEFSCKNYEVSS